jgi:peptidyl-tRNA hydrolase, PTH1 family
VSVEPAAHLVVGLGNPGPEYERHRHNIGYRVVDVLADRLRVRFRKGKTNALVADAHDRDLWIVLAKPTTYMNLSGEAVGPLARYFKVPPERIIVVHDEIDIPFGELRLKIGGGTAGHNGLESLIRSLGTKEFVRVRCGVGRPPGRKDAADFVLQPFTKKEEKDVGVIVEEAADAVLAIAREGLAPVQNRINTRKPDEE